ncbi:hypothetical protein Droror1_Dr00007613 [Drosera rotundifolia]
MTNESTQSPDSPVRPFPNPTAHWPSTVLHSYSPHAFHFPEFLFLTHQSKTPNSQIRPVPYPNPTRIRSMDIWSRARTLAQEISTRSQELTIGGSRITEIVTETAKQASNAADQIKIEALKRADQIKSIPIGIDTSSVSVSSISAVLSPARESGGGGEVAREEELERFGVTDELREFVKGITIGNFRDFPLPGSLSLVMGKEAGDGEADWSPAR